jgi:hypothetical protein
VLTRGSLDTVVIFLLASGIEHRLSIRTVHNVVTTLTELVKLLRNLKLSTVLFYGLNQLTQFYDSICYVKIVNVFYCCIICY